MPRFFMFFYSFFKSSAFRTKMCCKFQTEQQWPLSDVDRGCFHIDTWYFKKVYLFVMQSSYSYVIARRAKAERPTWQSPGTIFVFAVQNDTWYQEIATSLCSSQWHVRNRSVLQESIASCKEGNQYQSAAADKTDQIQLFLCGRSAPGHNRVDEPNQSSQEECDIAVYPMLQQAGQDVSQQNKKTG